MPPSHSSRWPWAAGLAICAALAGCSGLCLVGAGAWALAARQPGGKPPPDIIVEQGIEYGRAGDQPLLMDLARPRQGDGPFPAVVCIHGGGWRGGDRATLSLFTHILAQRGYVAVTVSYRFAPQHTFPAQFEDVQTAVRYLRTEAANLQVDPQRIGAMGGSAGGHLALLLATAGTPEAAGEGDPPASGVRAAASLVGPTNLEGTFPPIVQQMLKDLTGDAGAEALRQASPSHHLSPDDPPLLLIYGTLDELVPYEQATTFLAACQQAGVDAELITIEGGGHGSGGNVLDWHHANMRMVEFFDEHLLGD